MANRLSISLVIYHPDQPLLRQTLKTLFKAATKAQSLGLIDTFFLTVVDNTESVMTALQETPHVDKEMLSLSWGKQAFTFLKPGNVGYGAGHNLAIRRRCETFHLVINPDVNVHEDALIESIRFLQLHPHVGMVTPLCHRPDGQQEFLCKGYPSVLVLLLRGFAPDSLKRPFQKQLSNYDMRYLDKTNCQDILIASGCFMLFQHQALKDIEGFCESFFLYFEDFDLSIRLTKNWKIAYVPTVKITHYGGHSAKKGYRHIRLFVRSAALFFQRHGWRLW